MQLSIYKVCCSKQFPSLFSLPRACPCCILCALYVKTAARRRALVGTTAHLLSFLTLCAMPRHQDLGESAPGPRAGLVISPLSTRRCVDIMVASGYYMSTDDEE